jgi:hypothetical protein
MNNHLSAGFTYTVETINAAGDVIDTEGVKNLMPGEGLVHVLNTTFKSAAQVPSWYIGLFEGNYTPTLNDVAATFPALATECVTYTEATRVLFVPGATTGGVVDNIASKAEFTMSAAKTIYGGMMTSASAKGSTSGVLISLVRFGSPKQLELGGILRVTAGFTMASALS